MVTQPSSLAPVTFLWQQYCCTSAAQLHAPPPTLAATPRKHMTGVEFDAGQAFQTILPSRQLPILQTHTF